MLCSWPRPTIHHIQLLANVHIHKTDDKVNAVGMNTLKVKLNRMWSNPSLSFISNMSACNELSGSTLQTHHSVAVADLSRQKKPRLASPEKNPDSARRQHEPSANTQLWMERHVSVMWSFRCFVSWMLTVNKKRQKNLDWIPIPPIKNPGSVQRWIEKFLRGRQCVSAPLWLITNAPNKPYGHSLKR